MKKGILLLATLSWVIFGIMYIGRDAVSYFSDSGYVFGKNIYLVRFGVTYLGLSGLFIGWCFWVSRIGFSIKTLVVGSVFSVLSLSFLFAKMDTPYYSHSFFVTNPGNVERKTIFINSPYLLDGNLSREIQPRETFKFKVFGKIEESSFDEFVITSFNGNSEKIIFSEKLSNLLESIGNDTILILK